MPWESSVSQRALFYKASHSVASKTLLSNHTGKEAGLASGSILQAAL